MVHQVHVATVVTVQARRMADDVLLGDWFLVLLLCGRTRINTNTHQNKDAMNSKERLPPRKSGNHVRGEVTHQLDSCDMKTRGSRTMKGDCLVVYQLLFLDFLLPRREEQIISPNKEIRK